tara:strand:+ start:1313 stop:1813 length:501 start_codon:yes stop_codon:yes gene_type:complete
MPNNIFGNVGGDGLTNPLEENLLAANFRILDLGDPIAGQDAVTLSYYEGNIPSTSHPYDLYFAVTGDTALIPSGSQVATFQCPRTFTPVSFRFYLTTAPSTSTVQIVPFINGVDSGVTCQAFVGDKFSTIESYTTSIGIGDILTFTCLIQDAAAAGLKIVITGNTI